MVGYTDGTLSVFEWRSLNFVFYTEVYNFSSVIVIAFIWNSVVFSG